MSFRGFYSFFYSRRSKGFTGFYKMFHLSENPMVSNGGSPYHNTIYTVFVLGIYRILWNFDITISENRNVYMWIIFNFSYKGPVCRAFVHLFPGTAMDRNGL